MSRTSPDEQAPAAAKTAKRKPRRVAMAFACASAGAAGFAVAGPAMAADAAQHHVAAGATQHHVAPNTTQYYQVSAFVASSRTSPVGNYQVCGYNQTDKWVCTPEENANRFEGETAAATFPNWWFRGHTQIWWGKHGATSWDQCTIPDSNTFMRGGTWWDELNALPHTTTC
jgi:hypothetical protein